MMFASGADSLDSVRAISMDIIMPLRRNHAGCDRAYFGECYHLEDRRPYKIEDIAPIIFGAYLSGDWDGSYSPENANRMLAIVRAATVHANG